MSKLTPPVSHEPLIDCALELEEGRLQLWRTRGGWILRVHSREVLLDSEQMGALEDAINHELGYARSLQRSAAS